jgi:hypothetical protein
VVCVLHSERNRLPSRLALPDGAATAKDYRRGAEGTEKAGEIPASGGTGMRQRRRPQDDDARRIVGDAENAEKGNGKSAARDVAWSVVLRLNPHPSHETKAGWMGHPAA